MDVSLILICFFVLFLYYLKSDRFGFQSFLSSPFSFIFKNLNKIYKSKVSGFSLSKKNKKNIVKKNNQKKRKKIKKSLGDRLRSAKSFVPSDKSESDKKSLIVSNLIKKKKNKRKKAHVCDSYIRRLEKRSSNFKNSGSVLNRFLFKGDVMVFLDKKSKCFYFKGENLGSISDFSSNFEYFKKHVSNQKYLDVVNEFGFDPLEDIKEEKSSLFIYSSSDDDDSYDSYSS